MYYLNSEEERYLFRYLLPKARREDVADDLRGWNWHRPPLLPYYETTLALYEVAGRYCSTARDLWLRRVLKRRSEPNTAMTEGSVLHDAVVRLMIAVKRGIYTHGIGQLQTTMEDCREPDLQGLTAAQECLGEQDRSVLEEKLRSLWGFEYSRIKARLDECLCRYSHIGADSLAHHVLPFILEQRLDGSFLGLSSQLSTDAMSTAESMVLDMKFGVPEPFHRLSTTGYALVMEALYEFPVNVGCIVYAQYKDGSWRIKRDIHLIDDELRQRFIDERDEKMRMVHNEIEPKMADDCRLDCPWRKECRPQAAD